MSTEFVISPEVEELRDVVAQFCADVSSEEKVRAAMESDDGFDRDVWRTFGNELGILGLGVDEEFDGMGTGIATQALVVEQLGAHLFPGPVVGTLMLALPLLTSLSDRGAQAAYLPGVMSGETIAAVAGPLYDARFGLTEVAVRAEPSGDGWSVSGVVSHVPDLLAADLLLVPAVTPEGVALFAVDAHVSGIDRVAEPTMDLTRRQGKVVLESAAATLIADCEETPALWTAALRRAAVLLSAEQLGGGQRLLDLTVAYVGQRIQFGRVIGSFQAVKHRCADMFISVEQARSAVYHAAWAFDEDSDAPEISVSLAKATASRMYREVAEDAIQMHGGVGFTWEYTAHLYFKRATTDAVLLGQTEDHLEMLASAVLDSH